METKQLLTAFLLVLALIVAPFGLQLESHRETVQLKGYATATWEPHNPNYIAVYWDDQNNQRKNAGICFTGPMSDWNKFDRRARNLRKHYLDGERVSLMLKTSTPTCGYWNRIYDYEITKEE